MPPPSRPLSYTVISRRTGAALPLLELQVLARAYAAAWESMHGDLPCGLHDFDALGVVISFGAAGTAD
jgi:hypothetical protein